MKINLHLLVHCEYFEIFCNLNSNTLLFVSILEAFEYSHKPIWNLYTIHSLCSSHGAILHCYYAILHFLTILLTWCDHWVIKHLTVTQNACAGFQVEPCFLRSHKFLYCMQNFSGVVLELMTNAAVNKCLLKFTTVPHEDILLWMHFRFLQLVTYKKGVFHVSHCFIKVIKK